MRIVKGVRGHAPPIIFFKTVQLFFLRFRVYFHQILSLFFFPKITIFYIKNKYFRYTLPMSISHEYIFEKMLRLMRFGVYFETKIAIFLTK